MAITPIITGGFYPKSNNLYFMIIYLCIKYESKSLIFSKDIERKPFFVRDVHTDRGDTICSPSENGGGKNKRTIIHYSEEWESVN